MEIHGRTDLASEARGIWMRDGGATGSLKGVRAREYRLRGLAVTSVEILDAEGARALGKAPGHYDTLSLPAPLSRGDARFADGAAALEPDGDALRLVLPPRAIVVLEEQR